MIVLEASLNGFAYLGVCLSGRSLTLRVEPLLKKALDSVSLRRNAWNRLSVCQIRLKKRQARSQSHETFEATVGQAIACWEARLRGSSYGYLNCVLVNRPLAISRCAKRRWILLLGAGTQRYGNRTL